LRTRRVVVAALLVVGAAGLVVLRAGVLGVSAVTRFDVRVRAAANSHRDRYGCGLMGRQRMDGRVRRRRSGLPSSQNRRDPARRLAFKRHCSSS